MNTKRYSTFQEIDTDLKILRLQQDIEKENLKLTYQSAKNNFYPTSLLGGFSGIIQKIVISMVAKKVLKKLR